VDVTASIQELLEKFKNRLSSIDAQLVLRDQYEVKYGIYDHTREDAAHPLQLVFQHWSEDTVTNGELHERIKRYIDLDIFKYTGIPFDRFMELPTYEGRLIIDAISQKIKKEAPKVQAAIDALNR
jgi:hypothetical protein